MNWLAHLVLSEPTAAFRIGNLLPDLARASELVNLPPEFRHGVEQHRRIDAFTDSHPIVRRSMRRVGPPFVRYAGILVDIFYDHFLSGDWASWSEVPLPAFTAEVYASFALQRSHIPAGAYARLQQMRTQDWLCSYGRLEGVTETLRRVGLRFRKPVPLGESALVLTEHYEEFRSDFREFFPELWRHVTARSS